jgi:solute carrier family 26 (sodium-independent sulfate anion transporter), member 11
LHSCKEIHILLSFFTQKLKDIKTPENASKHRKIFGGALWLISTARNAILVIFSSFAAYHFYQMGHQPFILTGKVKSGLPGFSLPPFETHKMVGNETVKMEFPDMISELGVSIILVPIIAVLGNVAISKAFGGTGIDATKELVALSLSNVFGSFFSSIPVTGSFSRSAVNHASGVRTPIGGIYTGILVLLALSILTPYFQYIPRAALSAVIISAVIFMIEYEVVKPLWKCSKRELFTVTLTLVLSLVIGVEIGLLSGVLLDIAFLVQRTARPVLTIDKCLSESGISFVLVKPRNSLLCFPAIEYVRNGINSAIREHNPNFIILDCRNVTELDFTAAKGIGSLRKELAAQNIIMLIMGPSEEVKLVLKGSLKGNNVPQVKDERELDIYLQDHSTNKMCELQEVVAPLLQQKSADDDIETQGNK